MAAGEAGREPGGGLTVDRVVTPGVFSLDGQDFEVENNIWIVGDEDEVVVIDAAHDPAPIVAAVGDRRCRVIVATHGHNDHINAAAELAGRLNAPVALHPEDRMLWDELYPHRHPDRDLADGEDIPVGGGRLRVIHTPGHSPGGVCLHAAAQGTLFSGDTLFCGGPGATGRSFSDYPTILHSIRTRLFVLPGGTVVHTGHGEDTTIGAESDASVDWAAPDSPT